MCNLYQCKHFDYICMHQYCTTRLSQLDIPEFGYPHYRLPFFSTCSIDAYVLHTVIQTIRKQNRKNKLLVWDMRNILYSPIHIIDSPYSLIKDEYYQGICFLFDDLDVEHMFEENLSTEKERTAKLDKLDDGCWYTGYEDIIEEHFQTDKCKSFVHYIDEELLRHFFLSFRSDSLPTLMPLPSSNVYVNHYFEAKKIFSNGPLFQLLVYRMAYVLKQILAEENDEFDAFICASITGACIASALSVFYHKPVIYLKNIGPNMTANDERIIDKIEKDQNYVFVYDFMCMGSEFERIKMICNIRLAKILCSLGISYYRLPHLETANTRENSSKFCFEWNSHMKIAALFQINAFDENYYYCTIDKGVDN